MSITFEKFQCPCCDETGYAINMDPDWLQATDDGMSYVIDRDEAHSLYLELKEALLYD